MKRPVLTETLEERLARKVGSRTAPASATPNTTYTNVDGAADLVTRLSAKAGVAAPERNTLRANIAATVVGSSEALDQMRRRGANELMEQLGRMEEADRVLDLAYKAGAFDECIGVEDYKATALDMLAEQYSDLHVKVESSFVWSLLNRLSGRRGLFFSKLEKCPVRTLGGAEVLVPPAPEEDFK